MATLILKVTERCNSRCYYCDVVRKAGTGATMALDLLETTFARVGEYLREGAERTIDILWHGGEPLLVGPDYYRAAYELQQRHCAGLESRIKHSIQTNLTLFSEPFVEPLRRLGITAFGTSYDPEPEMRGAGSPDDSRAYTARLLAALAAVEAHGFHWGMIYVVTRRSLARPLDVFHLLTNFSLDGNINLNPVLIYDQERRDVAVTPAEYVEFLAAIFPTWWRHRSRYPAVEPFRALVETIIDGKTSLGCVYSGACSHHHVNVAPDGATSQCGRAADWGLLPYGNIADRSLAAILGDEQRRELVDRLEVLRGGDCAGCRFWTICHGGCPLDAWSEHRSFGHKSSWCEARRGFVAEHFEPLTGVRFEPRP